MESYWEWLLPELQEIILDMKAKMEHRDTVEKIGEFCLQPLPEDCHQGDSCCFVLFSPRKASHLSVAFPRSNPGNQLTILIFSGTVQLFPMLPFSPRTEATLREEPILLR